MKAFSIAVFVLLGACNLTARDLHLIDGRIFKNVRITAIELEDIRFLHDGGLGSIKFSTLTEADKREWSAATADPVIAGRLNTTVEKSYGDRSYAQRDYSTRSYGDRTYAERYLPKESSVEETRPSSASSYIPSSSSGVIHVKGYTRKDGTYVRPHTRRR